MVNETTKLSKQIDEEIEKNEKLIKKHEKKTTLLMKYVEGFTDILFQLATSSVFYAIFIIYLTIYKLFNTNNLELNLNMLLREGVMIHLIYIIVVFIKITIDDIKEVKNIKKYFNS